MDQNIEVPPFFLCPISLEIMKDPVTVSTGITYDRESIEKWLFSSSSENKNNTCPVTKQPLTNDLIILTPNHTLRRLIQSWCTINASHGIQRIPTPKPPVTKTIIQKLLKDASDDDDIEKFDFKTGVEDEALNILHTLHLSENGLKTLLAYKNGEFVDSLVKIMQKGIYDSRTYAVLLLKSMSEVANHVQLVNLRSEFFIELVQVLKDQISAKASKATLQTLIQLVPWGRNRIKVVEGGAVSVLIELLLDCKERKPCEMMLVVLEMLCQSADGRAELLSHAAAFFKKSSLPVNLHHQPSNLV